MVHWMRHLGDALHGGLRGLHWSSSASCVSCACCAGWLVSGYPQVPVASSYLGFRLVISTHDVEVRDGRGRLLASFASMQTARTWIRRERREARAS